MRHLMSVLTVVLALFSFNVLADDDSTQPQQTGPQIVSPTTSQPNCIETTTQNCLSNCNQSEDTDCTENCPDNAKKECQNQ